MIRGLHDKVAIITGGGGGIGRAIARRLADEAVVVGIFDRDAQGADETVRVVRASGGRALAQAVDITDYTAVQEAVRAIEAQNGPTDILINNAGWDQGGNFLDTEPMIWEKLIAINLTGPLNLHHVVLRGMVERRRGRVVNIASDAARVGSSGEAVYAAAKAGVVAFTKTVARELASLHITLNVVCPGPTDTPLLASFAGEGEQGQKLRAALERAIPFKRLGQPEDVAGIVAFLASDEASYITGQVVSVSGGLTMHG
jgi:2-hydroxycyclohexanecarboxyl-CoA dehydrogenase